MLESLIVGDRPLSFETGKWAQQASGSVVLRSGDAVVLVTAVADPVARPGIDFFPLTVEYRERLAGNGRIPGAYGKREARATTDETLACRLIDRSIRPLFPSHYLCETQVIVTVFSGDPEVDLPGLSITAASLALSLSDIPWEGPVAAIRVGRVDKVLVAFPTAEKAARSDMNFVVTVGDVGVLMVEGESKEVSEEDLVACLMFAQAEAKPVLDLQRKWAKKHGRAKRLLEEPAPIEVVGLADHDAALSAALLVTEKEARTAAKSLAKAAAVEALCAANPGLEPAVIKELVGKRFKPLGRALILAGQRFDGRGHKSVRPIECEVGVLPSCHGSALFTRGETQALASATLGGPRDSLRIEDLYGSHDEFFFLHYTFPPYSVGEVRPLRGPGRREIGHGMLAQRALAQVIPDYKDFPHTLRITSDILSSNGSSSMASVCGGCLAMMDAGVPIKAPVAGVAMGLIQEGDQHVVLTDILGDEDHLGDMDFKVCGTKKGVTALQMDLKIDGLTEATLTAALAQARDARMHILAAMARTLAQPRLKLAKNAEGAVLIEVPKQKLGDVIGPGGRNIRGLSESTGASLDMDDQGLLRVAAKDPKALDTVRKRLAEQVREPRVGEVLPAIVVNLGQSFARFELFPGTEAGMHISEAAEHRVYKWEDEFQLGDTVMVKVTGVDDRGGIRVTRIGVGQ
ncbi:MAG: polyribonucleotide nucleotidyltransferase [Deltaproteobacteria bacterium CG2_30_63_29]|nr:MAG: polyribonucleotide nucleotidyltransferase [Deltaproteobacteria bacterium CG2_30_63_29]